MKFTITFKDLSTEHMGHVLSMLDDHNRKSYPESRRVPLPTVAEHVEIGELTMPAGMASPPTTAQFYMVFREGGHSPTFKHNTQALASAEAKRIGRDTGSVTHVLAAVETIRPHAMPTVEEFATHAEEHGMRHNGKEWGMWRVRKDAYQPIIIAVRVDDGKEVASHGFPWNVSLDPWKDAKWFPLASDGSDLRDSIPF